MSNGATKQTQCGHQKKETLPGQLFEQAGSLLQSAGGEVLYSNVRPVGNHFQGDPDHKPEGAVAHRQSVKYVRMGLLRHVQQVARGSDQLVGSGQPVEEAVFVRGGLDAAAHQEPANGECVELRHNW